MIARAGHQASNLYGGALDLHNWEMMVMRLWLHIKVSGDAPLTSHTPRHAAKIKYLPGCYCGRCLNLARGNMYIIDFLARVIPAPTAPIETQRRSSVAP